MTSLTCETPYLTTGPMFRKLDDIGQGSAELILILGGLIIIVLLVGSYMSNIANTTQDTIQNLLKTEKDFLINKI